MTLREHMDLLHQINSDYHKNVEPLLLAKQQIERKKPVRWQTNRYKRKLS